MIAIQGKYSRELWSMTTPKHTRTIRFCQRGTGIDHLEACRSVAIENERFFLLKFLVKNEKKRNDGEDYQGECKKLIHDYTRLQKISKKRKIHYFLT